MKFIFDVYNKILGYSVYFLTLCSLLKIQPIFQATVSLHHLQSTECHLRWILADLFHLRRWQQTIRIAMLISRKFSRLHYATPFFLGTSRIPCFAGTWINALRPHRLLSILAFKMWVLCLRLWCMKYVHYVIETFGVVDTYIAFSIEINKHENPVNLVTMFKLVVFALMEWRKKRRFKRN